MSTDTVIAEALAEAANEREELSAVAERIEPLVEALLFVAGEALDQRRLAKFVDADEKAVDIALVKLAERYDGRGIVLRNVAGGFRFGTAPAAREVVEKYLLPPKTTLSSPALETLAIVAQMQPVTKGEIESIRGVNSDSVVNTLLDRSLICEAGRKEVVGRPMQYKTTSLFLESFGLNSLEDLPDLEVEIERPRELALPLIAGDAEPNAETSAEPSLAEPGRASETDR